MGDQAATSAFREALSASLEHPLDRRILLTLHDAKREVRYEELRRAVSADEKRVSPQQFKLAMDRLMACASVNRRLQPLGETKYASWLSLSRQGERVAQVLDFWLTIMEHPTKKVDFPVTVKRDVASVLRGEEVAIA